MAQESLNLHSCACKGSSPLWTSTYSSTTQSWHKGEHHALGAAVVGVAVLVGALLVIGEAVVAASKQCEHQ